MSCIRCSVWKDVRIAMRGLVGFPDPELDFSGGMPLDRSSFWIDLSIPVTAELIWRREPR